ncbi:type II phosphatidylinositol 4,5-bisphosphate 4-phosphatase-like [Centruroides vittatus]|uniref:type II phosphatidylinositol 4,5-bisphosphate 4-phosphatase-like n=1 Tax=Centruroides vittatus TaxID=120091 RepID=UPI00350FEE37
MSMDKMASTGMDERSPLLSSQNCPSTINYGQAVDHVIVSPISPQELPPPSVSSENGTPVITCQVCTAAIELTGKQEQYVVKCNNCNEATEASYFKNN